MATTLSDPPDDDPPHRVVRLAGDLDAAASAEAFAQQIDELPAGTNLILLTTDVPFIDSAGLALIIGAIRQVRDGGARTIVVTNTAPLARLLETTGIAAIAETADTIAEALDLLRNPDTRH